MSSPDLRVEAIFHEALDRAPAERESFVTKACAGDESLQKEVHRLLAAHEEAGAYFERPNSPEIEAELARLKPEEEGERIGRYKLLQEIGQGGFGTVWMAEQMEPVSRRVALKILKMGMDTREVIGRFEQERQALAMMDHPNIAKVFDAGATPFGRPYFVMELVKGVPITEFCDERQLDTRQRLELFADVCAAINHAHQKGVIHRDIKPSNVMITLHGDKPVVKVIDFGIAKATQGKLTDKTLFTRFEQLIGTPAYMSPEQAAMSGLDIDTRSDIYALGVLLYELLTGKPPFDAKSLVSAGYEEMLRIIREVEPPRPSLRLSTVFGDERTVLARARHIEPGKLSRMVAPDLDWIVMRAIEKDRTRRYETANGLALDVKRFLADEPVSATPPSTGYRFRKFARRNKLGLSAGAAVATALVAGLIASLWQAHRATRAEGTQTQLRQQAEASQRQSATDAAKAEASRQQSAADAAKATESELKATRFLYAADMNLVQQALRSNNIGRARLLLDRHRPSNGEPDLRGWEWRYLWQECRSGAQVMLTKREGVPVFSASLSPDGALLLAGYYDGTVELWDVPARKLLKIIQSPVNQRGHVAFSPSGECFAATMGRGIVKTVHARTGAEMLVCTTNGEVRDLSFSRDGEWLAVLTRNPDIVMILRANDGITVMNYTLPSGGGIFLNNARISPDKQRLYVSHSAFGEPALRCVSVPDARQLWEIPIGTIEDSETSGRSDSGFTAMDLSPDGHTLVVATGFTDRQIRVLDAGSGRLLKKLPGHTGYILQIAFSHDGQFLASTSEDQTIRLWDTATWTRLSAPFRGHNHEVNAVAISKDSRLLASGNKDGEVLLWDARAPRPANGRHALPSHIRNVIALPVRRMVLGQTVDGKWSLIDLLTLAEEPLPAAEAPGLVPKSRAQPPGSLNKTRLGLSGLLNATALSPDGKVLAVASDSGQVGLYDAATLAKIDIIRTNLGAVFGVAFSPDGQRLLLGSGGESGIALWDFITQQELLTLSSPDKLLAVEFADEGNTLLAGSRQLGRNDAGSCQFWWAPSWPEIEDAERTGGRWPQTTAFRPPLPPPSFAETKKLVEQGYREKIAAARGEKDPVRRDELLANLTEVLAENAAADRRFGEAVHEYRNLLQMLESGAGSVSEATLDIKSKLANLLLLRASTYRIQEANQQAEEAVHEANQLVRSLAAQPVITFQGGLARVDRFSRHGHWEQAATLCRQVQAKHSQDMWCTFRLGPLLIETGDDAGYEELRRKLLILMRSTQPKNTSNANALSGDPSALHGLDIIAKTLCLKPLPEPEKKLPIELVERTIAKADSHPSFVWFQFSRGLAGYRGGDYPSALETFDKVLRKLPAPGQAAAQAVRAMAQFRLGQIDSAKASLTFGNKMLEESWVSESRVSFSGDPHDWLIARILLREAKTLLDAEK